MLAAGVVGVITVGVDGRVVTSANATIPFLARFIGQGVEAGDDDPVIVSVKVAVPVPKALLAVSWIVNVPGLVGVPEMVPVLVLKDKPWGTALEVKLVGLWFVLGVKENAVPVLPDLLGLLGLKLGDIPAASRISLSSEGYFAANLWVDLRVGRVKLA
jgi:hypothetical protein